MKTKNIILPLLLMLAMACTKEQSENLNKSLIVTDSSPALTIEEAKIYVESKRNSDSSGIKNLKIDWNTAKANGKRWVIPLEGQPVYQNYKQGYRELSIIRNPENQNIYARILEIIPDAIYLQKNRKSNTETFTGRVFEYDLNYHLKGGRLYSDGEQVGNIRQFTDSEILENANKGITRNYPMSSEQGKVMWLMATQSCYWVQDSYVDANGDLTIHSAQICFTTFYDNYGGSGGGGYDGVGNSYLGHGTGGGAGGEPGSPTSPPPSNLPGENNNVVDPKKMMDCFSQITNQNAAFVVRIYVVEPLPGTSFNIGPNSFGHVAISLTKSAGNTTITQTIGFYPTGTGLNRLSSKAQILNNGFDHYDISSTYFVSAESFQNVIDYISNPPTNYHFTDFNCSAFVYNAAKAGGVPIPDPTTQIGLSGPGGAGFAKTPAGMASALREEKAKNTSLDVNEAGGYIPSSKGECK